MTPGKRTPLAPVSALEASLRGYLLPVLVGWAALSTHVCVAQFGAVPRSAESQKEELAENVFLPAPRTTLQRLAAARDLMQEDRFGEAVRNLGFILEGEEDFFFQPDRDEPIHRSLKAEAQRLLGAMPRSGRELYELQYGPQARRMLSEAVAEGDPARLAEVSRRFFHTEAGYEGAFLLGLHHLDHGRPFAAALTLERLLLAMGDAPRFQPALSLAAATGWFQAGAGDRAGELLADLKQARQGRPVRLGRREVAWFAEAEGAADWLADHAGPAVRDLADEARQWTMVRGNPNRNASAPGGPPLMNLRWEVPVADDPLLERLLAHQQQEHLEQGVPPVPELHPLVVDDVVLMRTTRNLLAVDVHTGKRLWEVPVDDPLQSLLHVPPEDAALRAHAQRVPFALRERVLEDKTFGSLSSDGQHVYAIEDLAPSTGMPPSRQLVRGAVRVMPGQPQPHNRLTAHDVRTGKRKWQLGGAGDEFALRMAETFFLGPPLPLRGQLFVLAEAKDEIRLLALDAATGDLQWAQSLAMVEEGVLHSPVRRLSGLSPAYADGIVVCPTSAGAVVAVDLATRSLLWGYRYGRAAPSGRRAPFFANQFGVVYHGRQPAATRWADGSPIIVDGKVLVSPMDSDSLYCLDLVDGRRRWSAPRGDDLYVACVHQGTVVLVGRERVRALALDDGEPAWGGRVIEFPNGGMPSGHGLYGGNQYLVPLTTAEIVAIDLDRGRTAHVARSRAGHVPGNLVSYDGLVLSQSARGVAAYYQLDVLRRQVAERLNRDPDDAEALALRGELLLDAGKRDEGIRTLHRSYELAADRRTAELLLEAMLDGLRHEFARYLGQVHTIEPMLAESRRRAEFLRVMADGLQRAGRWSEAFEHYLQLVEFDDDRRVEPIDSTRSVRRDRWIRARLAALRAETTRDEAAEIERLIAARMQKAIDGGTVEGLVRFLDYFGDDPGADPARDALVRTLTGAGKLLEVEMALLAHPPVGKASPPGAALARLAELLAQSGHQAEALAAYRHLASHYADAECLDGKTGRELIDALPDADLAHALAATGAPWPEGRIDVEEVVANRPPTQGRYPLDFHGDPGPFFRHALLRMDQSRRAVSLTDGMGRVQWSLSLVNPQNPHSFTFNPPNTYARAYGHLLVLSLGHRIIAIDTLGRPGRGQVRILWSQDLTQGGFDQSLLRLAPLGLPELPDGIGVVQHGSHHLGSLGPVTPRYVCFQHYRNLVAVDPVSGETLWVRHGVPAGATLFGDQDYILAAAPDQSEILVLRAADGSLVGRRPLPAPERFNQRGQILPAVQRRFGQTVMTTLGRRLVVSYVDPADGQQVVGLFDPLEQRYEWGPLRAAIGKTTHLGEELIGLLGPDGTLKLIRMEDGRVIFDAKLAGESAATEVHLLRAGRRYLVVTNRPQAQNRAPRINAMPGTQFRPIGDGRVYAFDLEGTPLWPKPAVVENQSLVLHQPDDLPVFVFAGQSYDPQKAGAERFTVEMVCLDKRTGRIVHRGSFTGPTSTFEVVGDPDLGTIEIQLQRNVVKLQLTDEPVGPEENEGGEGYGTQSPDSRSQPVNPTTALLKAIGGAIMKTDGVRDGAARAVRLPREPVPAAEP